MSTEENRRRRKEMEHRLKILSKETVYDGAVLEFRRDTVELPDGKRELWDEIHHKKGGGACVVPVLPDGKILLIRQYRPVLGRETLELPAGCREAGEDTAVTAERELAEETGYAAKKLSYLATVDTAAAYCDETTDIYLAENIFPCGEQRLDEAEEILTETFELKDLVNEILSGRLRDAKTAVGILAYASVKKMVDFCTFTH